jgi:uncharacterized protein YndB with AHSA1/START domain
MSKTIGETVFIKASPARVWSLLSDTRTWPDWSSAIVASEGNLCKAKLNCSIAFSVCIMGVHFTVEPIIEELEENFRIVWTGKTFGVHSRHEFRFIKEKNGTRLESTEELSGLPIYLPGFPIDSIQELTRIMLNELREAAEALEELS